MKRPGLARRALGAARAGIASLREEGGEADDDGAGDG